MDLDTLTSVGLTKGEANVYLTLLKLGNTTSGKIIKESLVSRSKVYDVLERLKQKGLVTEMIKQNIRFFEAADPERIINYLELKKQDIESKIVSSKEIVSDLNKLKSLQLERQDAKVYTGVEGLKTVYNEILNDLNQGDEYLAFGIGANEIKNNAISLFIKKFHLRRADKKVNARIIMHPDTKKEMQSFSKLKYYQYRYTDVMFPTNIAIWKDNVLTLIWNDKPLAFVIKSKQVAEKYTTYFNYIWKSSFK
jgi:HTH-type transcriptional regulator, sugar sensing transcriptional regulator